MFAVILALLLVSTPPPPPPPVTVQTLAGEQMVLPRDFTQSVVLVADFTKASRAETEPWARRLAGDARISAKARLYEVSILDGVPGFLRSMIISQMKSGIAPARQKQFLIVTANLDWWKRALASERGDDHAWIVVMQLGGAVTWRGHGAISEAAYQNLLRALDD
jgi:hypothetical protein